MGATPRVSEFLTRCGLATALDLAGSFDSEAEVRQSFRDGWQEADAESAVEAWRQAKKEASPRGGTCPSRGYLSVPGLAGEHG